MHPNQQHLASSIRTIPDFPKKGIMFRDITTLLKDRIALADATKALYEYYREKRIDKIACIESRGFILGAALALKLDCGFVPIRKKGKLPADKIQQEYALEYGTDAIEIHKDAISSGERILIHDDLLATGGTAGAACKLIETLGGTIVGLSFIIELSFLKGRSGLGKYDVFSLIEYDVE
ncbi:MAG: adenine phosphoribosyltransferase [Ignavibacteriales bacterium]|nr:adenine phosphoribosyltransferase [Ignavibacteriales bacterium]